MPIFGRNLGKNTLAWYAWTKTDTRPKNVPAYPSGTYRNQGWKSWTDWLGTRNRKGGYRPFEEAREFARNLSFKNEDEWVTWAKSDARPEDIPAYPDAGYKDKGWLGWGDWLGTGRVATHQRVYLPFEEARARVHRLDLKGKDEWTEWAKSDERPENIPANPPGTYKDKGWAGWADWLGVYNRWTHNAVLSFLHSIQPVLPNLLPAELYAIMRQNGMMAAASNIGNSNTKLIKSIKLLCSSANPGSDFEEIIAEIQESDASADASEPNSDDALNSSVVLGEQDSKEALPLLRSIPGLKAVDLLTEAGIVSDEETIEFLVANRVGGLWQAVLNNDSAFNLDRLRAEQGGVYFNAIRSRFLGQYESASNLPIPAGYDFRVEGVVTDPNLMQRLTAYRVLTERRLGNWSGVGAGKTLSAILSSRVVDARLTVIIAFNSTIEPWSRVIKSVFPDSAVLLKERGTIKVDRTKHTYLILNFETFQQPDAAAMVRRLVEQHQIDLIVLDEIHSAHPK